MNEFANNFKARSKQFVNLKINIKNFVLFKSLSSNVKPKVYANHLSPFQ